MYQVHISGRTTDRLNTKELITVFIWYMNMQSNGLINSGHATSIFWLKFSSNLSFTVNTTLLELMKTSMNQFLIFGIKGEKFTLTRFKLFSNTEWTSKQNLSNKKKQPWGWRMSVKVRKLFFKLLRLDSRTQNMPHALWQKFYSKFTNLTIWYANWWTDIQTFTEVAGTGHLNISTIEVFSDISPLTTLLIAECSYIWTVTSWKTVLKWWLAATTLYTSTNST